MTFVVARFFSFKLMCYEQQSNSGGNALAKYDFVISRFVVAVKYENEYSIKRERNMALIAYKECSKEISSKAKPAPSVGQRSSRYT
jgi:hypothetical protein